MSLRRQRKERLVSELTASLREAPAVAVASFRSLRPSDGRAARASLRPAGGRLRVVPKRLLARVCAALGWPVSLATESDSVTVAWSTDLLGPARVLGKLSETAKGTRLVGGFLEGRVLTAAEVQELAYLPLPAELRRRLVGTLAVPLRGLVGTLRGVLTGLPAALSAKAARSRA